MHLALIQVCRVFFYVYTLVLKYYSYGADMLIIDSIWIVRVLLFSNKVYKKIWADDYTILGWG